MKTYKTTYDEKQKIWSGMKIERYYPADYSIGRAALEVMQNSGERIGQICAHNGREFKYEELASLTLSVADHFTKLGMQQCDVIGVCASNSDYLAPLFFGAMLKGLVVSSLDVTYDKEGIKYTFGMTKPKLMFCDGGIYERVQTALEECGLDIKIYTMKDHIKDKATIEEFLEEHKNKNKKINLEPLKYGGSQAAVILCSSGTTGLPKGVIMSHEDLLNSKFMNFQPNDRQLCFSSLHWYTGLFSLVWGTLEGLTRVVTSYGFTPENLLDIIEKYKITQLLTPPSQLALTLVSPRLKTANLSSVQGYSLAGSAVSYPLVKQMKPYFPQATFYNAYGMSELRGAAATGVCNESSGFVGQLGPNLMCKILDDNGQRLGPNQIGEILFANPYKWLGYASNPEASAAAVDAEGWIIAGDVGYFDEEGNIYTVDRKKDILKYNNFHYFPTEIEHVIYELPDIVEVCCFGLPDVVSTDLPAAAVVKKVGSTLSEQEIYEHVAKRMAHFKHLRGGVYFLEKIPKTSTGKPQRSETKKICEKLRNS